MFRRSFIQRVTSVVGAGGLVAVKAEPAVAHKTITYSVKGFSCAACALGLEVMLRQQRGVVTAKASYPSGIVVVGFDPALISDGSIQEVIKSGGFRVEEAPKD